VPSISDLQQKCPSQQENQVNCTCTYAGCPRHGLCCQCISYHLSKKQLPGCCFPPEVEVTYDRSFKRFIETHS
jgi:hypothetical protein